MIRRTVALLGAIALAAAGLGVAGCRTTVNDLEKWRNRPRSEEKFVEWMLEPEATPDVRAKAIEMLFEQFNYEGADYLPRVADLPQEARDQAIRDALPHVRELLEGAQFSLGGEAMSRLRPVQVRDGAIMLMATTETPEVDGLITDEVLVPWLREHYRPCITSTGRHPNSRILSMVGPGRGLPIVASYIRDGSMDDVICQNSYLAEVTWIGETSEELATAYTERWAARPPDTPDHQRQLVAAMITVPESRVLKNWIFQQLLETDAPLEPDVVDAFLDYVRPLTDEADTERYLAMIQNFDGFLRWIGFQNVVRLRGAAGLEQALNAFPSAGVWGKWGAGVFPDGLRLAANWACGRPQLAELGDAARLAFETGLEINNLVARAVSINCLRELGNAETIELLRPQTEITSIIPSWGGSGPADEAEAEGGETEEAGPESTTTIGELATEVIAAIEARLAGASTAPEGDGPEGSGTN